MTLKIDLVVVWGNPSSWDFLMRKQAQDELMKLADDAICIEKMLRAAEEIRDDFDDFEELLYSGTTEEIKEEIGFEYFYEEEEDEDEE